MNKHLHIILNQIRGRYRKVFKDICLTLQSKKSWAEYYEPSHLGDPSNLTVAALWDKHIGAHKPLCIADDQGSISVCDSLRT